MAVPVASPPKQTSSSSAEGPANATIDASAASVAKNTSLPNTTSSLSAEAAWPLEGPCRQQCRQQFPLRRDLGEQCVERCAQGQGQGQGQSQSQSQKVVVVVQGQGQGQGQGPPQ